VFSDVAISQIRRRIALVGSVLILSPLLVLSVAGWIVMQRISQSVSIFGSRATNARLVNLTRSLVDICRSYQRESIDTLKRGRNILDAAGSIRLNQGRLLAWRAKNETTGQITELRLPVMAAGNTNFLPVVDFSRPAPLVDEIEKINGTPATIFQRMNERGDMLRICTSLKTEAGTRDISRYIPAGSDGPMAGTLRDVLAGKTYVGSANLSGANYLTAYQPLEDELGNVVGMLSTVLAEEQIAAKVGSIAARYSSPDQVGLFAWRASGVDRGTALITAGRSPVAQDLWSRKDSSGKLYVQEICLRALTLPAGEIAEYKYRKEARVGSIPRTIIASFAYVPELNWVVGYAQPEEDLLAGEAALQASLNWGMWLWLGAGAAGTGWAVRVWIKFSENLAVKLSRLLRRLKGEAKNLSIAVAELSARVKRDAAATGAKDVLNKAARTAAEIGLAIRHIDASSDSVSGVMEAVDQIAFATNMLAVKTALEASHVELGSQPVAGIAEELRLSAERCREAARHTQTELQQSRLELEKGSEEVLELARSQPGSEDENTSLQRQAENLSRLAEAVSHTVERLNEYLTLDRSLAEL
jgi:methyl-accepting chemotaxis protein